MTVQDLVQALQESSLKALNNTSDESSMIEVNDKINNLRKFLLEQRKLHSPFDK